ncbi:hypothetical protein ES703_35344 [subsurface metagenome]
MVQPLRRGTTDRVIHWRWRRFKLFAVSLLGRFPPLKWLLHYVWKGASLLCYKWRVGKLVTARGGEFDVDKIYWVDPERIKYSSLIEFQIHKNKGKVIGGTWDQLEKRVEDLNVYVSFKERFMEGKKWEDTSLYQWLLNEIGNGRFWRNCRNRSDLERRFEKLDFLFQSIKNTGYKCRNEVLSEENACAPILLEDEIAVNVGRNGDLLLNNGVHRFAIVKLLGIRQIPVKITVRHSQWVKFRSEVLLYAKGRPDGKLYQPITHPDLQDLPSLYDSEFKRFNIIQENLSVTKGRLLDIGAHWGYFCHRFEELGFDCYAVENDGASVHFLRKLKRAENRQFKIVPMSIFEYQDVENLYFDVVLALNIFHHFLKEKNSYLKLLNLLKRLKLKEMYFQPNCPSEPQMRGAYKVYSEEEFVEFILQASKLNKAKFLGRAQGGRGIYKLSE